MQGRGAFVSGIVSRIRLASLAKLAILLCLCALAAGCSVWDGGGGRPAKDPKLGVAPSPRLITRGPIPKGGGRHHVGKPYKIGGKWYRPQENPAGYRAVGIASWYGDDFHGRQTANGEIFDLNSFTAAHPTLPLPSYIRVTNLDNGRAITVRVNDRGPYHSTRLLDVSKRTANALGFRHRGMARVQVDYIRTASLGGSDDRILLASLTAPGAPGQGGNGVSMVASAAPVPGWTPTGGPPVPVAPPAPLTILAQAAPAPARAEAATPLFSSLPLEGPPPERPVPPPAPVAIAAAAPAAAGNNGLYIQAGTFRDPANANRLGARLSPFGGVDISPVAVGGEQLYRVVLGPIVDQAVAQTALLEAQSAGADGARMVAF